MNFTKTVKMCKIRTKKAVGTVRFVRSHKMSTAGLYNMLLSKRRSYRMSKNGNKAEKPVRVERKATFAGALIAFLLCVAVIMGGIVGLGLDAQTALVGASS